MVVAALVFSACLMLVSGCWAILIRWAILRKERQVREEVENLVRAFIQAPDENTPSPLACMIDQGATLLASRLMQQIKAMLAGVESGLSKQEQTELLSNASQGSPLVGMIAGMLPKRIRSGLIKNPQMIGALSSLLDRRNGGSTQDASTPRKHRD